MEKVTVGDTREWGKMRQKSRVIEEHLSLVRTRFEANMAGFGQQHAMISFRIMSSV